MGALGLVFICIGLGLISRRFGFLPENAVAALNRFVIYISLPAVVIHYLHDLKPSGGDGVPLLLPALMPWLVFFGAIACFGVAGRILKWDRKITGALILTGGLGNTSFVGIPLIAALMGAEALPPAVLIDQLGTFLALATGGILVAFYFSGRLIEPRVIALKVLTFPPFIALILAFMLRPFPMPVFVDEWLQSLAATLVPLSLVAVGMQLRFSPAILRREALPLALGLGYKMCLAPALVFLLYGLLVPKESALFQVIVLEAAMAPMITAGVVATEYELKGDLAALMLGIGIPLSLVTVPLLYHFL